MLIHPQRNMNATFPDPIHLEDAGMVGSSRIFRVEKRLRFFSKTHGVLFCPAGTLTDGASIPKVFHSIMGPFGEYFAAAVFHDYFYKADCYYQMFTRADCDALLLEGMEALGVGWVKRRTIYAAVRAFGWRFFRKGGNNENEPVVAVA